MPLIGEASLIRVVSLTWLFGRERAERRRGVRSTDEALGAEDV